MLRGAVTHQLITRICFAYYMDKKRARTSCSLPSTSSEISHS